MPLCSLPINVMCKICIVLLSVVARSLELKRNITSPSTMRKNILPNSQSDCREMTPLLHAMHFIHSPCRVPDRHYCSKSRAVGSLMWYEHIRNHFSKQYFHMLCPMKNGLHRNRYDCIPIIICVQLPVLSNYHQHTILTYKATYFDLIPCFCVILLISLFSRLLKKGYVPIVYLVSVLFECVSNTHTHTLSDTSVFVPYGLLSHTVYIIPLLLYFAWANQRRRQYYIQHTEQFLNELYYIAQNCTISHKLYYIARNCTISHELYYIRRLAYALRE